MARMRGASPIIGTASTEDKAEQAHAAGADEVILYTQQDFVPEVRRIVSGGVDVVYDSVGKDTFDRSLDCLKPRGTLVLFGASSGAVPPFDINVLQNKGSLFVTRPTLAHYTANREELLGRANDLFTWIKDGKLRLKIDREYPLSDAVPGAGRPGESRDVGEAAAGVVAALTPTLSQRERGNSGRHHHAGVEAEPVHPAHVARVLDLHAAVHDDLEAAGLGDLAPSR